MYEKAIHYINKALENTPQDTYFYYQLIEIQTDMLNYEENKNDQ